MVGDAGEVVGHADKERDHGFCGELLGVGLDRIEQGLAVGGDVFRLHAAVPSAGVSLPRSRVSLSISFTTPTALLRPSAVCKWARAASTSARLPPATALSASGSKASARAAKARPR